MKLDNNEKFSIYRLCRNEEVFVRLKKENNKYPFIQNILVTNLNYFEFINKIIAECQDEYALVCHDDVTLPLDISYRISETITKANEEFGNDSWGVVSNSGVEFLSNKSLKYFKDNDFISIQPGSLKPRLAVFLDDNTLLLNLKNIRENSISLPNKFEGFHLYNFILLVECYK
ncbi:MAG: hypothetical protein NTU76_00975, partial [Candidatus Taylorbacteria bacterium]|nr:hypothetical protein [Candidatus Taylorbacteria bacterium]